MLKYLSNNKSTNLNHPPNLINNYTMFPQINPPVSFAPPITIAPPITKRKARRLPKESQYGNIEYKLLLSDLNYTDFNAKFQQLKSQLNFRLHQGSGKAIYIIGYHDDGVPSGIPYNTLLESLKIFNDVAISLGATIKSTKIFLGKKSNQYCANIFIIKPDINTDLLPSFDLIH